MAQSATQITGAGPRNAFIMHGNNGNDGCTVDQVLGVNISAARTGAGKYTVTHNMGKTGYCAVFTAEDNGADGIPLCIRMFGRSGNTCDLKIEDDAGSLVDPDFVHGVFYD